MFKGSLLGWEKIVDLDFSSKRWIFETKLDILDNFFSWFSIWTISSSNFELLNFMWLLYNDAANEFADFFNSYKELTKLYAELSDEDVELLWT